jgi:uncharacterized damage-inducible protein DinB
MNIPQCYNYLVRARRDLWSALENGPDEVLSRPLLEGDRFHSIKDVIMHIPDVEDGWTNGDIRRGQLVQKNFPDLMNTEGGPIYAAFTLKTLLDYWRAVEQSTLAYLPTLTDADLKRVVTVDDWPDSKFTVDGLLWHVMIHEMRHTAQISILLRTQHIKPPFLDLLNYLPVAE